MQEKSYQILFVDQDEDVCATMLERLTSAGYRVISACSLDESLSLAKIGLFDLYLFGHSFSTASGMKLCCLIRDFDETTPLLFYSGSANSAGAESALEASSEELEQAIARLLPENDPQSACGSLAAQPEQSTVKVAIIGLGDCLDLEPVRRYVSLLPPRVIVMANGARGVGFVAETAARERGLAIHALPLDWARFGRKAGWQRNRQLVECADRVALFWDQQNQEALSLLKFAQRLRKPIEFYTLHRAEMAGQSAPLPAPAPSFGQRAVI